MEQNNQDNNGNSSSISSHTPPAACYTVSVSQHTMLEMLIQGCKNTNKPILCLTGSWTCQGVVDFPSLQVRFSACLFRVFTKEVALQPVTRLFEHSGEVHSTSWLPEQKTDLIHDFPVSWGTVGRDWAQYSTGFDKCLEKCGMIWVWVFRQASVF